jgi:hypothetical protein
MVAPEQATSETDKKEIKGNFFNMKPPCGSLLIEYATNTTPWFAAGQHAVFHADASPANRLTNDPTETL